MACPEHVPYHWHLPHLNWWLQEWHQLSHLLPKSIAFTFICHTHQVTFIHFTAVRACPVVSLCQCPGISQCWLTSCESTLLLQAWMSCNNCLYSFTLFRSSNAAASGGLSTYLVQEHAAFEASLYLRTAQCKGNLYLIYLLPPYFSLPFLLLSFSF